MTRRELGAAVNVMWVIFLIVLLLGAGAFIYFGQTEIEQAKDAAAKEKRLAQQAQDAVVDARQKNVDLSSKVGFVDLGAGDVYSSIPALEAKLETLKGRFPNDIGAEDKTREAGADRLLAWAERFDQAAQTAQANFTAELAKRGESETAKDEIRTSMDSQLTSLNSDLRDSRDQAQSVKGQDDASIAGLQDRVDEVTAQLRERETEHQSRLASAEQEKRQVEARVAELTSKVKLIGVDDDPWAKDGEIVSVGRETGLVFVNIGSNDLLRQGVKFDVFRYGKGGTLIPKGAIEIREIHADSAVGGISKQISDIDPIAAGDIIANPHFSTERSKVFTLLGTFPVYGKSFLEKRLMDLGAEVEDSVNSRVDFVVLGQKAPEEDALEVSELPGYKMAQELGIQMMPIRSIDRFLKP
ncbi:MAG: BRCT domain-containing protein [Planctomycetota bacterium]